MPRFATYIVFSTTAGRIAETARQYSLSSEYEAVYVTPELRPNIERSRPDYWKMANQYLSAGHKGFCICQGSDIAGMAWLYYNNARTMKRVTYYPLEPNHVWFHADWVNPTFRNRGLHKSLVYYRALYVQSLLGDVIVEANIDPRNTVSSRNYEILGFCREGKLRVLRLGGQDYCWYGRFSH